MAKKPYPLLVVAIVFCFFTPKTSAQSPSYPKITPENISQLSMIRTIGYGWSTDIAFSLNGEYFAVGTVNGVVMYKTDDFSAEPRLFEGQAGEVAFSPDSRKLASEGYVWDTASGDLIYEFPGRYPTFNSRGDRLITASGQDIVVLDAMNGNELLRLPTGGDIREIRLSADDVTLAIRDMRTTTLWNLQTGQSGPELAPAGIHDFIQSEMVFSSDGILLLSVGWNGYAIWDVTTGDLVFSQISWDNPDINAAAFSPDDRQFVIADGNGCIGTYDTTTNRHVLGICTGSAVWSVAFHPDGTLLASVDNTGCIHLWNPLTFHEYATLTGYGYQAEVLGFNTEDSLLSAASMNGSAWQFDSVTGKQRSVVQAYSFYVGHGTNPYPTVIKMNQEGSLLATGSYGERHVRLWNPDGELLGNLDMGREGENILDVAISADSRIVAALSYQHIFVWARDSAPPLVDLPVDEWSGTGIALNPSGELLAIGKKTGEITLLEWSTNRVVAEFQGSEGDKATMAFSPDGSVLAFSSDFMLSVERDDNSDNVIRLGDTHTGALLHELEGFTGPVTQLVFSPDGSVLASIGDAPAYWSSGKIRFWNPATGEALTTLETPTSAMAFRHDGTVLATYHPNGTIALWAVVK